jgi:PAS domain S-box-containing protein
VDDLTAPPGRMSIPTAVCFLMSGIALILFSFKHNKAYIINIVSILGGITLALGLIGLLDYVLSVYTDHGWQQFTVMAMHTTSGFLLVGFSLILMAVYAQGLHKLSLSAQVIPLATVLIMLCLSLAIALENNNIAHVHKILKTQLESQVEQTKNDINFVENALTHGVKRWELQGNKVNQSEWQADAQLYVETLPYLNILALVEGSSQSVWQVSVSAISASDNLDDILFQLPSSATKHSQAHSISTQKLGKIIVITLPLFMLDKPNSFLLAVFDFAAFFKQLSVVDEDEGTWLDIRAGKDILFTSLEPNYLLHYVHSAKQEVNIQGLTFEFEKGFLVESTGFFGLGILSSTVLIAGCLFTFVMLVAIYAYQKSRNVMSILNSEKERFRLVLEAAPGAMLLVDSAGTIEFSNTKAEQLFGYRTGTLLGKNVDILVPLDLRLTHAQLRDSFAQSPKLRIMAKGQELFGQHKNGKLIPLEIELCPVKSGPQTKVLASIFDLSERTKQLLALKRSKEQQDRAGKIAKIGGWQLDIQSDTLHWSLQTYKIHEVPMSVPLNPAFANSFYNSEDQALLKEAIDNAMLTGNEWDLELPLNTLMNNKIWVRNQGQVEFEAGKPIRIMGAIQDITERREVILELERSNQELNNFAYVASHDLKSPLRGIDQLASWLTEDLADSLSAQTQEHLRLMRSRINRMENLLDDLLAYARAGRTEAQLECVDIMDFVQQVFDFSNNGQHYTLEIQGEKADYLLAKTPLELVLRNLINNAIKHHDRAKGNIVISIEAKVGWLEFSVADDGPGIPVEHQQRAFAMFQTLQPRDKVEGSGMGLAIVRKVVETFGGTIDVSINQPRGAIFRFNFPAKNNPR